jgi:hypothetical protein
MGMGSRMVIMGNVRMGKVGMCRMRVGKLC